MNLLKRVPGYVLNVLDALEQNNHKSYLVGGAVRDLLLCKQPKDYDITTSALPEQVKSIFSHVVLTGEKHGEKHVSKHGEKEITGKKSGGTKNVHFGLPDSPEYGPRVSGAPAFDFLVCLML